ncbi:MAG TPA: tetratricopeptide repeat protein, partial [Chthoniobacterales bacterium]|nr:tetratricopeptide repeat protein [Chthoniobacterales bacterium]
MNLQQSARSVLALLIACATAQVAFAQRSNEVRRAQPVEETPIPRALPVNPPAPGVSPTPRRALTPAPATPPPAIAPSAAPVATPRPSVPAATASPRPSPPPESEAPPPAPEQPAQVESEAPDRRQLDYANALFGRKLYDLAIPEYEKFLGQFPGAAGRASAYFYLGECYRALNKTAPARTSFQSVLDEHPESEFAGPAA